MDQLGGYRLVRKLGEGPRAELHLARTDGESEAQASVAVKHYRDAVDDASIVTEIDALARATGDHAVELLDVATAPSGHLALILDRLPGGSLGRLLASRPALELGELPTILSPLGGLVDRMHQAGVVHRGIRLESVLFDRAGAPMLACFGRAELMAPGLPPAALELVPGALADQRALASLAAAVLDRAEDQQAVRGVTDWLATSADDYHAGWGAELARRVLELAPAIPVDFSPPALPLEVRIPARIPLGTSPRRPPAPPAKGRGARRRTGTAALAPRRAEMVSESTVDEPWVRGIPPDAESWNLLAPTEPEPWRTPPPTAVEPWRAAGPVPPALGSRSAAKPALDAAGAPDWVAALIPGDVLARVRASLAAVRAPVWIAAGLVGVGLVTAMILVPQDGSGAAADGAPTSTPSPTATQPGHGWTPSGGSPSDAAAADPVHGDDPILALVALLDARDGCIRDRSVLCLDAVGQVGSSALDDDQRLIRTLQDGAETPHAFLVDSAQVTLVERLGDTALLDLADAGDTNPASVLMMRTEAGWRIRDYLEP